MTKLRIELIERILEEKNSTHFNNMLFANSDALEEMTLNPNLSQEEYAKVEAWRIILEREVCLITKVLRLF